MIQHIVLLKLKPGVTDEQVEAAFEAGRDLPDEIPGLMRFTYGRDRSEPAHGFSVASMVELADEDALERYLEHPRRLEYLENHVAPIEEDRIQLDVPSERAHLPRAASWYWGISPGLD